MDTLITVKRRTDLYGLQTSNINQIAYCVKDNTFFHLRDISRQNKRDAWEQITAFPQATNINATVNVISEDGYLTQAIADVRYMSISASIAPINNPTFTGIVTIPSLILNDLTDGYVPYKISATHKLGNSPIYSDGTNVGIGTTTLDYKFEVRNGSTRLGNTSNQLALTYDGGTYPNVFFNVDSIGGLGISGGNVTVAGNIIATEDIIAYSA